MFTGCTAPLPPIGPPGHIELIRSAVHDSLAPDPRIGRLVVVLHWSSDSLDRVAKPPGAFVHLTDTQTHFDTSQSVRTSGVLAVMLSVPQLSYHFQVRFIGANPVDTSLVVRRGYTDTARVFLQTSSVTICS